MNYTDEAVPIPREGLRYAIPSSEEVWVQVCSKFFERHGSCLWHQISKEQAFDEMVRDGNGRISTQNLLIRINDLYRSVGIED